MKGPQRLGSSFGVGVLACMALTTIVPGCTSSGEERTSFDVLALGRGGAEPFENEPPTGVDPWTITLDRAALALGPVYLFEGEPLLAQVLGHLSLIRSAHAHPGHYQEGDAMGEMLSQAVVDLMDPEPTVLGSMQAVTGPARSARIGLGTVETGLSGSQKLNGHALLVSGRAEQAGEIVDFEACLDIDLFVEGIPFDHDLEPEAGHLLVEVDLERWLRRVDFAAATQADGSQTAAFEPGSQAHNALTRGVDNTLAYSLTWEYAN